VSGRSWRLTALAALLLALSAAPALAQSMTLDLGEGGSSTGRIVQMLLLLTVLSLAPAILVTVTSFTRIIVVLSFLRNALGIQQTPPNVVLISLALFLTGFVMAPALERSYNEGIAPLIVAAHTAANVCRHAGAQGAAATIVSATVVRRILGAGPSLARWWRTLDDLALRAPESVEAAASRMGEILSAGNIHAFESFVAAGLKLAGSDRRKRLHHLQKMKRPHEPVTRWGPNHLR